ncbi:MAG: MATE family efflux transporter [Clostridia bacterium]|nr:MATE family efflux transporter [Clostridia bacterium]
MKTSKNRLEGGFYRTALALALPIAFQNLLTSSATLVDTAMITGLGNDDILAAVGLAGRFAFLLNVICFGFSSGCASLLSQYWGAKDTRNVRRSYGFVLLLSLAFGVLYAVLLAAAPTPLMRVFNDDPVIVAYGAEYLRIYALAVPFLIFSQVSCVALRSVEMVHIPLISAAASVGVNVFMNWCLIYGNFGFPRMELRGAALASAIGCIVQALIVLLFILLSGKNPFHARPSALFAFDKAFCGKYVKVASPVLFNETMWAIGTNVYVMVFGRQDGYAGYTLYENIQQIFFVFFVGICGACSIMVGMRIGRGDHEGGYQVAKRFSILTPVMGVILGALLILVRDPLLSLFPVETALTRQVASECLLFYGCWIAIRMIPYTQICGIFRAGGDTKTGCFLDLAGLYATGIPAVLIAGLLFRPSRFVILVIVMFIGEDLIKGILCVRHFLSRKWIKQITDKRPDEV